MSKYISFIDLEIKNVNNFLMEVHHYIKWQAPIDVECMSREEIFKVSCEAMRITVRLTQIMGWLMVQKAALESDSTLKDAFSNRDHILRGKSCLDMSSETDFCLPSRLHELLKESRELYERMMRLESMSLNNPPLSFETRKKRQSQGFTPYLCYKKNTSDSK